MPKKKAPKKSTPFCRPEQTSTGEEWRRERDQWRHYLDVMDVTMVALDAQGRVTLINRAGCELLGLSKEEVLGQDWIERFLPEHWQRDVRQVFDRIMNGDVAAVEHFENPIRRPDGQERVIQWHNSALTDDEGRIIGALASGIDVTDRKRAEDALRESQERLKAIVDTAVDAIITIDQRGIIDSVNPATERMFGYSKGELIGQNVKVLMPSPYHDEHDDYIRRYLETGEAKIIGIGREAEARRKDGAVFPVDLAVSELHEETGGRLFTGIIRDITERKAEHERLLQAERLALLGEAMAGLTHESRNALARSHANLRRLARRLKGNDELLQLIDGAIHANEDIRRQFEEVRDYAAPRHLYPESIELSATVRRAWDELVPERKGRNAELRIHSTHVDLTCRVDAHSMRHAFRNILENSLAACADPLLLDVEFSASRIGEAPAVRVSIRDNGPGLPPEVAERAFDAFVTTKTKGTGLGLAIVKRTVEAHGGEVAFGMHRAGLYEYGPLGAEIIITLPRRPPS